jgi:hypothetical protein
MRSADCDRSRSPQLILKRRFLLVYFKKIDVVKMYLMNILPNFKFFNNAAVLLQPHLPRRTSFIKTYSKDIYVPLICP